MKKRVSHVVKRPGLRNGDPSIEIPVAEDLVTTPGIRQNKKDVDFYSRSYPLESQSITNTADSEWAWTVYPEEEQEGHREHVRLSKEVVTVSGEYGDIEPTVEPAPGKDVTEEIKAKARDLGLARWG